MYKGDNRFEAENYTSRFWLYFSLSLPLFLVQVFEVTKKKQL